MGLLGNMFGGGQVNNGMGGPLGSLKKGFSMNNGPTSQGSEQPLRRYDPESRYQQQEVRQRGMQQQFMQPQDMQQQNGGRRDRRRDGRRDGGRDGGRDRRRNRRSPGYSNNNPYDNGDFPDSPPAYGTQIAHYAQNSSRSRSLGHEPPQPHFENSRALDGGANLSPILSVPERQNTGFRPLALPQTTYGEGKPFLRAYSDELQQYGIPEAEFIKVIDSLNKAIIPNPEAQIFQKTAQTVDMFVPGAGATAIMAGRVAIGAATAIGHGTILGKTLSQANLRLFIPNGLEICIGKTQNVDEEAGYNPSGRAFVGDLDPESRLDQYGEYLMPISVVYPEQQKIGRQDPIAMWVKHTSARDAKKSLDKAAKERYRGRRTRKGDGLEGGLQWLIVRKASADATAQWEKTLRQSESAMAQERAQG